MTIELTPEQRIKVEGSESIYKIMREILQRESIIDQDKEHLWVVGLSHRLNILYVELIGLGTYKSVEVEPMEIYSWALQKRCANIILVHNHPSGELKPSQADKDITDRLIQVGKIVKLEVIDHLVISTEDYLSFVDEGLMEELKKSTKYVPPYLMVEQIKKTAEKERELAIKAENQKAKRERNIEIARLMKAEGESVERIVLFTGLTEKEIVRL